MGRQGRRKGKKRIRDKRKGTGSDIGNQRKVWEGYVVGIVEIGWDRGGKGFLSNSVGLEAIEDPCGVGRNWLGGMLDDQFQ